MPSSWMSQDRDGRRAIHELGIGLEILQARFIQSRIATEEVTFMGMASFATTARTMLAPAVGFAILFTSSIAQAHFTLDYPPEWIVLSDTLGDPQKAFPCGVLSTDSFTMSGMMTTFAPGQTITVKWTEEVAHDGWFRIALSYMNGAEFQSTTDFPEPVYATDNSSPALGGPNSLDASIETPPVPPVLMDDIAPHSAASVSTPMQYSQDIVLPTMPCTKCVLQVIQIMLNHPVNQPNNVPGAAYTYHHCAFIAIQPNGDGGTQVVGDAGAPLDAGGNSSGGGALDATTGSIGSDASKTGSSGGSGSNGSSGGGTAPGGSSGGGTSSGAGASNGGTTSSGSGVSKGSGASAGDAAPTAGAAGGSSMGGSGGSCTLSPTQPTTRPNANTAAGLVALGFMAAARRRRRRV